MDFSFFFIITLILGFIGIALYLRFLLEGKEVFDDASMEKEGNKNDGFEGLSYRIAQLHNEEFDLTSPKPEFKSTRLLDDSEYKESTLHLEHGDLILQDFNFRSQSDNKKVVRANSILLLIKEISQLKSELASTLDISKKFQLKRVLEQKNEELLSYVDQDQESAVVNNVIQFNKKFSL